MNGVTSTNASLAGVARSHEPTVLTVELNSLNRESVIGEMPLHDCQVPRDMLGADLGELLRSRPELPGVVIVGGPRPCDMLSRQEFYEKTCDTRRGPALLTGPVVEFVRTGHPEPLILSGRCDIHEATQLALQRDHSQVYDPVVVRTENGKHLLLDTFVLLQAESHLVATTNEEIRSQKEAAEQATRAKSAFLANVSHEIRTPLNGIIGFSETILSATDLGDAQEQARTILVESEHLLALINQLLDHAKIEAGKLELEYLPLSPRELLESLVSTCQVQAKRKGLQLRTVVDDRVPDYILGDPLRLRQILLNLTNNALKFTGVGSVTVRVETLEVQEAWARLRFSVTDTGIGIPEDKQDAIFDSFTQADGTVSRKFGGTGLGTSIARQIVTLMDGDMGLESQPGKGSTFWFEVEVAVSPPPDSDMDLWGLRKDDHPAQVDQASRTGHILIAEDYPTNQQVVKMHLEAAGHTIQVAENGVEALEACRHDRFDLIFMDIQMPEMDGFEAARRIRSEVDDYADVPIVALTANSEMDMHVECLASGMNDLITKPVRRQPLLTAVSAWLSTLDAPVAGEEHPSEAGPPQYDYPDESPEEQAIADELEDVPSLQPPPKDVEPGSDPMDLDLAIEEFGGNEGLLCSVAGGFIEQVQAQLPVLRQAIDDGDHETLRAESHKIKGAAGNLTAEALSQAARALEMIAREQKTDQADEAFDEFETQYGRLREYLDALGITPVRG